MPPRRRSQPPRSNPLVQPTSVQAPDPPTIEALRVLDSKEFKPIVKGRLFTTGDALVDDTCEVHPADRLAYDALPPSQQERFNKCRMFLEKHGDLVKLLQHLTEIDPKAEDPDIKKFEALGIYIPGAVDAKKWRCPVKGCNYTGTLQHLISHLRGKKHIDMQNYACRRPTCDVQFYQPHDRVRHERDVHSSKFHKKFRSQMPSSPISARGTSRPHREVPGIRGSGGPPHHPTNRSNPKPASPLYAAYDSDTQSSHDASCWDNSSSEGGHHELHQEALPQINFGAHSQYALSQEMQFADWAATVEPQDISAYYDMRPVSPNLYMHHGHMNSALPASQPPLASMSTINYGPSGQNAQIITNTNNYHISNTADSSPLHFPHAPPLQPQYPSYPMQGPGPGPTYADPRSGFHGSAPTWPFMHPGMPHTGALSDALPSTRWYEHAGIMRPGSRQQTSSTRRPVSYAECARYESTFMEPAKCTSKSVQDNWVARRLHELNVADSLQSRFCDEFPAINDPHYQRRNTALATQPWVPSDCIHRSHDKPFVTSTNSSIGRWRPRNCINKLPRPLQSLYAWLGYRVRPRRRYFWDDEKAQVSISDGCPLAVFLSARLKIFLICCVVTLLLSAGTLMLRDGALEGFVPVTVYE